jgi:uncharacterized damage-inducible protein DinB
MKRYAVCLMFAGAAIAAAPSRNATDFAARWTKTRPMMLGVAEAMPAAQYAFRPDPPSMTFGEQILHIVQTNNAFCAGLKDQRAAHVEATADKAALIKLLGESFDACAATIGPLSDSELEAVHNSPDGRMPGREVLLALYAHMAHHRGQMEVYLRIKGIAPPGYVF